MANIGTRKARAKVSSHSRGNLRPIYLSTTTSRILRPSNASTPSLRTSFTLLHGTGTAVHAKNSRRCYKSQTAPIATLVKTEIAPTRDVKNVLALNSRTYPTPYSQNGTNERIFSQHNSPCLQYRVLSCLVARYGCRRGEKSPGVADERSR